MANKINVKLILELRAANMSRNSIAATRHISKNSVSDVFQYYQKLSDMAQAEKMSIQDYIRDKIFHESSIFTPEEAVKRFYKRFSPATSFSLLDAYGNNWTIERGPAGVFGKRFYNYIIDNEAAGIEFVGLDKYGRRAMYRIKEVHGND